MVVNREDICFNAFQPRTTVPAFASRCAVGGTGKYQNWRGTYTDRVFVGFGAPTSGVGDIIYYDQLWFSISGSPH